MKLGALLRSAERTEGSGGTAGGLSLNIGEDWLQGRSAFGGLQAAFGVLAMRRLLELPDNLPLRVLQVGFLAPVPQGPVLARARRLRSGKSVTQVEAQLLDAEGALLCSLLGVFGASRGSSIGLGHQRGLDNRLPSHEFRYLEGITPQFTQHFAARWRSGGLPFTGIRDRQVLVDLDMLDDGPASESHLLAIADYIPPVALSWLSKPAPGSSLTWSLELLRHDFEQLPLAGWHIDAQLLAAGEGYTSQATRIYSPDRRLAAISQQCMVVFG